MRWLACLAVSLLLVPTGIATGTEETLITNAPVNSKVVAGGGPSNSSVPFYIEVPAGVGITKAVMDVRALAPADSSAYPIAPEILLDGQLLWDFNGTGYGPFGLQNVLSNGSASDAFRFGSGGGNRTVMVILPRGANVEKAELELAYDGPTPGWTDTRLLGEGLGSHFGYSVAPAGDVNGDGYDDLLVGAPYYTLDSDPYYGAEVGRAYLFFGGPDADGVPDIVVTGRDYQEHLGFSVSGAGDVNHDGYSDFLIGAPGLTYEANPTYYRCGRVLLFHGGPWLDLEPDIVYPAPYNAQYFGYSVSGGGDLNGDGYPDMAFTCKEPNSWQNGKTFIYLGGPGTDDIPDIVLGYDAGRVNPSMATIAGDVNGDGLDDVLVAYESDSGYGGRCPHVGPEYNSRALLYFGGRPMDSVSDVEFMSDNRVAFSFKGAGDVNADGFDDLVLTSVWNWTVNQSGLASIHLGSSFMDNVTDLVISKDSSESKGVSGLDATCAGDVNGDGFEDLMVGGGYWTNIYAPDRPGRAMLLFGGPMFDTQADEVLYGPQAMDFFGGVVSGAGDFNRDGNDEFTVSSAGYDGDATDSGLVNLYSRGTGLLGPRLAVSNQTVWAPECLVKGAERTGDFSKVVNDYLRAAGNGSVDGSGNELVEVPLSFAADGPGNLTMKSISIRYSWTAKMQDFSAALSRHLAGTPPSGLEVERVRFEARAASPAVFNFTRLELRYDPTPVLVRPIPNMVLPEDTCNSSLLDLWDCFRDDELDASLLRYTIVNVTNPDLVNVTVVDNRYLSADALTGEANDNWTGEVNAVVACDDTVSSGRSNRFMIQVTNVNDPPRFTSSPPGCATVGEPFTYQASAVDGDGDMLSFWLENAPVGMTCDRSTGEVSWLPLARGDYPICLKVYDGQSWDHQNFTLHLWKNTAPVILPMRPPPTSVVAGHLYEYQVPAFDEEGDTLQFILAPAPSGMFIDAGTGWIQWYTGESLVGIYHFTVVVRDCYGARVEQEFTVEVLEGRPTVRINGPAPGATLVGVQVVRGTVKCGALPIRAIEVQVDGGPWLRATGNDSWAYLLDTKGLRNGPHGLVVRADDGMFMETASLSFTVDNPVRTAPQAASPAPWPAITALLIGLAPAIALLLGKRAGRRA